MNGKACESWNYKSEYGEAVVGWMNEMATNEYVGTTNGPLESI